MDGSGLWHQVGAPTGKRRRLLRSVGGRAVLGAGVPLGMVAATLVGRRRAAARKKRQQG
jgi:hypothetical protein